jgi:hypothetical protein
VWCLGAERKQAQSGADRGCDLRRSAPDKMGRMIIEERSEFDAPAKRRLPVLSVTSAGRYRACPRSYFYANRLGRRARRADDNRRFGTLFHDGQEAYWRWLKEYQFDSEGALGAALAAIRKNTDADPFERIKAEVLMGGYNFRWSSEPLTVLWVEKEFESDLKNPLTSGVSRTFRKGGKMDVIVQTPDHQIFVMEHKTSSEDITDGSHYWSRLTLDSQISMYLDGARTLGYDPAGCVYDVIGKPNMKPLKATPQDKRKYTKPSKKEPESRLYAGQRETDETPEEYGQRLLDHLVGKSVQTDDCEASSEASESHRFDKYFRRAKIVRLESEEQEAAFNFWGTAVQIRESIASGIWPKNDKSCFQYRKPCDYFPVCSKQTTIDNDVLYVTKENN